MPCGQPVIRLSKIALVTVLFALTYYLFRDPRFMFEPSSETDSLCYTEMKDRSACRFYALMIDAGSTGTRLHIFRFKYPKDEGENILSYFSSFLGFNFFLCPLQKQTHCVIPKF